MSDPRETVCGACGLAIMPTSTDGQCRFCFPLPKAGGGQEPQIDAEYVDGYLAGIVEMIEDGITLEQAKGSIESLRHRLPRLPPAPSLAALRGLVAQQAEDTGLWFLAQTAPEAYLQQELRRLHAAIEALPPAPTGETR